MVQALGVQGHEPLADPRPREEVAGVVEEHLIGVDVGVIEGHPQDVGILLERPGDEGTDREAVVDEGGVRRRGMW